MKCERLRILLFYLAALAAAGCDREPRGSAESDATSAAAPVAKQTPDSAILPPATYAGLIPCADCPGIRTTLTLFPDGIALLRSTYLEAEDGKDQSFIELTAWTLTANGRQLKLEGSPSDRARFYAVQEGNTLLMLGRDGKPPDSGLDYTLRLASAVDPIEGPLNLRGHYRYRADAALFEACRTGKRFPVAMEADNLALERAYLEAVTEAGAPLFVTLEGRLVLRPAIDRPGQEELTVIPDRFGQVIADGDCRQKRPANE